MGKSIWEWRLPDNARQHHDWQRLSNGHILVLAAVTRHAKGFVHPEINDQGVYEVDAKGAIVWSWFAGDHVTELGLSRQELDIVLKGTPGGSGIREKALADVTAYAFVEGLSTEIGPRKGLGGT